MKAVNIVFPHQLFEENPLFEQENPYIVIEEFLFFRQYAFHKQKLAFHRASMKYYSNFLVEKGKEVDYIESALPESDIRILIEKLKKENVTEIVCVDVCDDWLQRRMEEYSKKNGIRLSCLQSPMFLNSIPDLDVYFNNKKRFFQTDFYKAERKKRAVLIEADGKPVGEKWTFDTENRLKYPKNKTAPFISYPDKNEYYNEAVKYINTYFNNNPGELNSQQLYPHSYESSKVWLRDFLNHRLWEFGPYEDAIVSEEAILHHSVLTPMLNVGLITPQQILDAALEYYENYPDLPLNSLEGFIRQIMGWREFIRAVYLYKGREERTRNYWGFKRKIPKSFYEGSSGIVPLDNVVRKVLKTGYCHHIERLMVLCEFDPDEVYRWFMELFIDAYDWVMVPNVYGMSQFADGGLMATKPYISGSNYLMKMSDFKKGEWQEVWDGLFWRFMHVHRDFFLQNPRLAMLVKSFDKMSEEKRRRHLERAEEWLRGLGD